MSPPFITTARLQQGELHLRNRSALKVWVAVQRPGEYVVEIRRAQVMRNLDQNALYWAGFVTPLSKYTGYPPTTMHAYLKQKFLPRPHVAIADADGVIVDEADLDPTTTILTVLEFSEYLHAISAWVADTFHGAVIVGSNLEQSAARRAASRV